MYFAPTTCSFSFFIYFFLGLLSVTVANTNENDERMDSSNFGQCVDIFAPVSSANHALTAGAV